MKNIKYLLLAILSFSMFVGCTEDDNDELTGDAATGGLVTLNNVAIGYVVGNDATYTVTGQVYQGNRQTSSINVYKSFTDSQTGNSTNEELLTSVSLSDTSVGSTVGFGASFTYEDLISGLMLDGSPLPSDDSALNIGDFWTLRFESTLTNGQVHMNASTTKVSVGTRFAGIYRPLYGEYYRIGVLTYTTADWLTFCPETVIESVDATTYRVVEYFGPFNGNEWYFQIDSNDVITYPDETPSGDAQTGNGQPFITCESNPSDFSATGVPCGAGSNYVVRDDVDGADQLHMTFGYYTAGSGPRIFYHILEKIVD